MAAALLGGTITLVGVVILCFCLSPWFTTSILGLLVAIILFILSEQWFTHNAAEFENRFWTAIAFFFGCICIFGVDSPLRFPSEHVGLAWAIICIFTYLAHICDRHLHRLVLQRLPQIRRVRSTEFNQEIKENVKQKIDELDRLMGIIDQQWMSSTFQNIFLLPRVLFIENQINTIFTELADDELDLLLSDSRCKLGWYFYKIKDHRIAGPMNRTFLLDLLIDKRMNALRVTSKAKLLDGLQIMKLAAHPKGEEYVKRIILNFSSAGDKPAEFSEFKSITDNKGNLNSMHKLVYKDIKTEEVRQAILKHIKKLADTQNAQKIIRGKVTETKRKARGWRKIISDVDDTLLCSGGSYPAGVDKGYPKKEIYPGVLAFYRELDLGASGDDDVWDSNKRVGNLTFLTARPHAYKELMEKSMLDKIAMLQRERNLHTNPAYLWGVMDTGLQYLMYNNPAALAKTKIKNFMEYQRLYPEFSFVFIGDNGQGDVLTAERILKDKEFQGKGPHPLERVYIHEVIPRHLTFTEASIHQGTASTSTTSVNTVSATPAAGSVTEGGTSANTTNGVAGVKTQQKHDAQGLTKADLDSITKRLREASTDDVMIKRGGKYVCYFVTYIDAAIDAYQHNLIRLSGLHRIMMETKEDFLKIKDAAWDIKDDEAPKTAASGGGSLRINPHYTSPLYQRPEPKRDCRIREINAAIRRGNKVLASVGMKAVSEIPFKCKFEPGTLVKCLFGSGVVLSFRPTDGMYQVLLQWDHSGSTPLRRYTRAYLQGRVLTEIPFVDTISASTAPVPSSSSFLKSARTPRAPAKEPSAPPTMKTIAFVSQGYARGESNLPITRAIHSSASNSVLINNNVDVGGGTRARTRTRTSSGSYISSSMGTGAQENGGGNTADDTLSPLVAFSQSTLPNPPPSSVSAVSVSSNGTGTLTGDDVHAVSSDHTIAKTATGNNGVNGVTSTATTTNEASVTGTASALGNLVPPPIITSTAGGVVGGGSGSVATGSSMQITTSVPPTPAPAKPVKDRLDGIRGAKALCIQYAPAIAGRPQRIHLFGIANVVDYRPIGGRTDTADNKAVSVSSGAEVAGTNVMVNAKPVEDIVELEFDPEPRPDFDPRPPMVIKLYMPRKGVILLTDPRPLQQETQAQASVTKSSSSLLSSLTWGLPSLWRGVGTPAKAPEAAIKKEKPELQQPVHPIDKLREITVEAPHFGVGTIKNATLSPYAPSGLTLGVQVQDANSMEILAPLIIFEVELLKGSARGFLPSSSLNIVTSSQSQSVSQSNSSAPVVAESQMGNAKSSTPKKSTKLTSNEAFVSLARQLLSSHNSSK